MVYAEFARVIDLQFPGLLCYETVVGVMLRLATVFPGCLVESKKMS